MFSSAPAKILTVFLALAFVLSPAICCCFGTSGQAMAAQVSEMAEEDCHGDKASDTSSINHEKSGDHSKECAGADCEDCSYASAFDGVKSDKFVVAASVSPEPVASLDNHEAFVAPMATMVTAIYPRRGPPPLVRTTLVALHVLLLN